MPPPTMKRLNWEKYESDGGPCIYRETFHAYGLAPNSANTIRFPEALANLPLRVFLTPVANGALAALVSLDTAQGECDPTMISGGPPPEPILCLGKLGFDRNNLYVFIGDGVEFLVTVEHIGN